MGIGHRSYGPGVCCWTELRTSDVAAAVSFYTGLFGWTARNVPIGPDESYTVLEGEGVALAAVTPRAATDALSPPTEGSGGDPDAHWRLYTAISTRSAPAELEPRRAPTTAARDPQLARAGRWAAPGKPLGAIFAASRAEELFGDVSEPCGPAVIWMDLYDGALSESASFCRAFFDDGAPSPAPEDLPLLYANEESAAATGHQPKGPTTGATMLPGAKSGLPAWSVGFLVKDCDETIRRARSLGGRVAVPPRTLDRLGRATAIVDSQGATFVCLEARQ